MQRHPIATAHKQQGFTLIELLIAVVIVSIGLLGHAALQIQSVNTAQQARFAQTANVAMLDIVQRFSSMPQAALDGEYDASNLSDGVVPFLTVPNCASQSCSRVELAQYEIRDWFSSHSEYIPQLRFSIAHNANLVTVTMTWDANLSGSGVENCASDSSGASHQCSEVSVWLR